MINSQYALNYAILALFSQYRTQLDSKQYQQADALKALADRLTREYKENADRLRHVRTNKSYRTNGVSRDDCHYALPDKENAIIELQDYEIEEIADSVGDILAYSYTEALESVLENYLQ